MHASIPTRFRTHAAFTLIEVTIVVIIMAILSVSLALAYQEIQLKVRFDAHVNRITGIFQEARSSSLSNRMIDGTDPTAYYELSLDTTSITLTAYANDPSVNEILDTYAFDSDITLSSSANDIYYFPPTGEVCISTPDCDSGDPDLRFILGNSDSTRFTQFDLTTVGGYVDVTQLVP